MKINVKVNPNTMVVYSYAVFREFLDNECILDDSDKELFFKLPEVFKLDTTLNKVVLDDVLYIEYTKREAIINLKKERDELLNSEIEFNGEFFKCNDENFNYIKWSISQNSDTCTVKNVMGDYIQFSSEVAMQLLTAIELKRDAAIKKYNNAMMAL